MQSPEVLQTDADLLAWDWRADLDRIERRIPWLARQTSTPARTVYSYAYGQRATSIAWLRKAAAVLGRAG
jgi:hypothetical protein